MEFAPSSIINLCNVSFDNTYKNQIYFANTTAQLEYFAGKIVKTLKDYTTVRKVLPNGSLESRLRVGVDINSLYKCNYLYYQNANHGAKYFYCFIKNLVYINEGVTEIVFETDVYQTWLSETKLLRSYVVREHAVTDNAGDNIVAESFSFEDFFEWRALSYNDLNAHGYLVGSSENIDEESLKGKTISGIYQGLHFYYFNNDEQINNFLATCESKGYDCIVFISVIPAFNTANCPMFDSGYLNGSSSPSSKDISLPQNKTFTFQGYTPKNKKLYTYPYTRLVVSNHSGDEAEYKLENFKQSENAMSTFMHFTLLGDISASPSLTIYPCDYSGVAENIDAGISINSFPQVSFNSDSFKLWLAKNQFGIANENALNVAEIVGGFACMATGVGGILGAGSVVAGVKGITSSMNSVYQAKKEPNKCHGGSPKNNLLTAIGFNKFDFYYRAIKKEYAQIVDDFFTMFGYATNKVKVPNVSSRPCFNYVQTIDVNISGAIPNDDMKKLKEMYNNGVTFWKPTATLGDYSQSNNPS